MNIIVDWRKVEQLGLSGDNLPSSATFLFRPPSLWQKYRGYLIAGAVIFLLQTILTIELALAVRQRKKSEQSARELASRLIHAQEEERRRIAAELHDDVSQRLALVAVHLDTMRGSLSPSNSDLIRELSALHDKADLISSDIHQFSHDLHPASLDRLGLGSALRHYCLEFSAHPKIAIDFSTTGDEPPMSPDTALAFFRIGQECLMNVAKHSGASHCRVSLIYARNRISLSVEDNGKGFDPKSAQAQAGLGIRSMRERLRSIGGSLRIQSSPRHGTTIFAEAQLAHTPGAPPETSDSRSPASAI
jgi:signal transduction histidine kinase